MLTSKSPNPEADGAEHTPKTNPPRSVRDGKTGARVPGTQDDDGSVVFGEPTGILRRENLAAATAKTAPLCVGKPARGN